jgi:hypothetical protein
MEALLGQQDSLKTPEAVTKRITIEARRVFEGQAGDAQLEGFARDAVTEIWGDSIKVTTFVPVLAMRRVRELVEREQSTYAGMGG